MKFSKLLFLLIFILASCTPAAATVPAETSAPPTSTSLPPTTTATPVPEQLTDAKDLSVWIEEFVDAYDGTVTINGMDANAGELTTLIQMNPDPFLISRMIQEVEYHFLVVNGIPLAMQAGNARWQQATVAKLSELAGITLEFSRSGMPDSHQNDYLHALEKVAGPGSRFTFSSEMDTCRIFNTFTIEHWTSVLENWDGILRELDQGHVPDEYPYQWQGAYNLIDFARAHVEDPQFRGPHLVELNLPAYCMLADSIVRYQREQNPGKEKMIKILEFVVRTRVLQFPEIMYWNVEDEMIAANVEADTGGDSSKRFWNNVTGLEPTELTIMVVGWIKKDNPQAKTYVVEDTIFEEPYAPLMVAEFDNFIRSLHEVNAPVDGIISENNFWIFDPPSMQYVSEKIDEYNTLGFTVGGSETMIITGDTMINDPNRVRKAEVKDRDLAQAAMYQDLLGLYLDKGIMQFGFGGIDDNNAWTNDVGLPDANPLLFDDNFLAKPSYYAIVQILYEHIP